MNRILSILLLFFILQTSVAQLKQDSKPFVGGQIFIEPGQSQAEIDNWFKLLKESNMEVCRIRMFEIYMKDANGNWDFDLFDQAFKAADKYDIKVMATLFPETSFEDVGGFKYPDDDKHLARVGEYIKQTVTHFSKFKSMFTWVLINEPGGGNTSGAYSKNSFANWKKSNATKAQNKEGYYTLNFDKDKWLRQHQTDYLDWLAKEVRKYDSKADLHVNPHNIYGNLHNYDFAQWRGFLNSLGGSAHASWHFGYFKRNEYAVGLSGMCEIMRSGAGEMPWFMTELQGGNNTYSGYTPMCPTKQEIEQWLWTVIGSGGKGGVFWTFNPRSSGFEAGEWAMIDFQDKPTDRVEAAASVAKAVNANVDLFSNAKPIESGVNLLYIQEAISVEKKFDRGFGGDLRGRQKGAVIQSVIGYYEALSQLGVQANIKEISEFDFSSKSYAGKTIILAHQVSIPKKYVASLETFVSKGGKLIVEGLSGYYDENGVNHMKTTFSLQKLFGANISEFVHQGKSFTIDYEGTSVPAHGWKGYMVLDGAKSIVTSGDKVIGARNSFGKGEVVWIPEMLGLAAKLENNYKGLYTLINKEIGVKGFESPYRDILCKDLMVGKKKISIVMNKGEKAQTVKFSAEKGKKATVLFGSPEGVTKSYVNVQPEETKVVLWE